jgi:hypothetical protein
MARIRKLTVKPPVTSVHPTEVDAEVREVEVASGEKLIQLSTFGSDQRVSEPKVSQTIQIDRNVATELRAQIDRVFGAL